MNKEMNINEVISELGRINALYYQHQSLTQAMDSLPDEKKSEEDEFAEEIVETLHAFRAEQDNRFNAKKPSIATALLTTPPTPPKKPDTINPKKDIYISTISGLTALISLALFVILSALGSDLGMTLGTFIFLPAVAIWFITGANKVTMFVEWQKGKKEWQEKQKEWEKSFIKSATKEENERFLNECKAYDACFLGLVEVCSQKYAEELKRYEAGLESIEEAYLKKQDQIHKEVLKVSQQLDSVTLIHRDLFENAWRISSMLTAGRADSLKEAINLALDEERKDREEAARRAEALQQEAILEQQARDNRAHNEAMQRAAAEEARAMRAHNEAMERAAQEQAREAARQSEMAQKQARDAQRAASARCAGCANSSKCSYMTKQNAGSCGAYRPR